MDIGRFAAGWVLLLVGVAFMGFALATSMESDKAEPSGGTDWGYLSVVSGTIAIVLMLTGFILINVSQKEGTGRGQEPDAGPPPTPP